MNFTSNWKNRQAFLNLYACCQTSLAMARIISYRNCHSLEVVDIRATE